MKQHSTALAILFLALLNLAQTQAQTAASAQTKLNVKRDLPYAEPADPRQKVDIYAPEGAKNLPVVFWIHGGGWQAGDKTDVQIKPQAFVDKGFVFVSTNYRLLPNVDMGTIIRDVAKSVRWVHDHIAEHGGDPKRILVMGHSAGAQLAALICTDDRYLKAEGLSLAIIKGCVPGRRRHLRRAGHHRDGRDALARAWPAACRSLATARSSATIRRSIATSPPSRTWRRTRASRRS